MKRKLSGQTIDHRDRNGGKIALDVLPMSYANGGATRIDLYHEGERWTTLTINWPDAEFCDREILVKTYAENERVASSALASGLFIDTGRRVRLGYPDQGFVVEGHVWRLAGDVEADTVVHCPGTRYEPARRRS